MANTRYKGANSSERLTLSTLSDNDMFQTRHLPGTVNDADKGVSKALLQALPIAVCATAAATAAKVAALAPESCPDFTLANGRAVHVYFSAANTASVPTLNLAGTGALPITYPDGSYVGEWPAGCCLDLMYISIADGNTAIERWVLVSSLPVDEVTLNNMHSVTSNAVAEGFSYSTTEQKTGGKWIDGKPIYRKVIDCGTMPKMELKNIPNVLSNIDYVISIQGSASNGSTILPLPYSTTEASNNDAIQVYISDNKTSLNFICKADLSSFLGYVTVEYTKTTD